MVTFGVEIRQLQCPAAALGGANGVRDRRRYGIGSLKFLKVSIIG